MSGKKGNNYIICKEQGIAKIELNRRKGENLWAIIDLEDLERVLNIPYTWFAKYTRNSNNKSGYRNVCWSKSENKWIVQLQVNKHNTVLGKFPKDQLKEAAKFAEKKRKELYGEFAGHN